MKTKTKPNKLESFKDVARKKFEALPEQMQLMICLIPHGKNRWINLEAVAVYLDAKTSLGTIGDRFRRTYLREKEQDDLRSILH